MTRAKRTAASRGRRAQRTDTLLHYVDKGHEENGRAAAALLGGTDDAPPGAMSDEWRKAIKAYRECARAMAKICRISIGAVVIDELLREDGYTDDEITRWWQDHPPSADDALEWDGVEEGT